MRPLMVTRGCGFHRTATSSAIVLGNEPEVSSSTFGALTYAGNLDLADLDKHPALTRFVPMATSPNREAPGAARPGRSLDRKSSDRNPEFFPFFFFFSIFSYYLSFY